MIDIYDRCRKRKTVLFDESARYEFPKNIVRVTAGKGGEALLILGSEKTALVDCGMAYCADKLIENIHNVLKKETQFGQECSLDYILATHTHYDHIGAMAAVKTEWSEAKICAGAYATKVFSREGAIQTIQKMSNMASRLYGGTPNIQIDFEKCRWIVYYRMVIRFLLGGADSCTGDTGTYKLQCKLWIRTATYPVSERKHRGN